MSGVDASNGEACEGEGTEKVRSTSTQVELSEEGITMPKASSPGVIENMMWISGRTIS